MLGKACLGTCYVLLGILHKARTLSELTLFTEVCSAKRWVLSKGPASIQC